MDGEIFSKQDLEKMPGWKATFRHRQSIASARDSFVCLVRTSKGYVLKMPGKSYAELANMKLLQESIFAGRLELVRGELPRTLKSRESQFLHKAKKKKAHKVALAS